MSRSHFAHLPHLLSIAVALSACSGSHAADPCAGGRCGTASEALSSAVDLISPATCTTRGTHLVSCAIAAQTLTFTPFESAVPLRTTVAAQKAGNCSTPYPLSVSLKADGDAPSSLAYIAGGQTVLRHAGGDLIKGIALADGSGWTKTASFDTSCRISLSISPNELDVSSKGDAQAIVDALQKDATAKADTAARYNELMLYSQAFVFLQAVAENFLGQLTDDALMQLRASATDAQPALEQVITDCNSLSQDQKKGLFKLEMALGTLDHPEDWKNPDGSLKTLRDFLGADEQKVLDAIHQLGQQAGSDGGTIDYAALYQQAEREAAAAEHKLELAKQQLAAWLG
ncbi:MAG: hypothetical protein JWN44_4613 [Myxococcales bacterium]|nr:hypothetical protein [Myxococcales bacterium]